MAERRSVVVRRRVYHVDASSDVWHIDGNHKLIRWWMVVHGGVDRYLHLITYFRCHTDSRSEFVLTERMRSHPARGSSEGLLICTSHHLYSG